MGDKIDDEFCKDVDEAVRAERDRPEWRRNRMKWECVIMDERREAREEGREEGRAEGRAKEHDMMSQLVGKMLDSGRIDELRAALGDDTKLNKLYAEFGITNHIDSRV